MTVTQAGPAPASGSQDPSHPVRRNFGRRKFDRQPTQQAPVLIATNGFPIPAATLRRARELSEGDPVAVVTIARIYGSSLGLPNPGLMPTRKEMADQKAIVEKAVGRVGTGRARDLGPGGGVAPPGQDDRAGGEGEGGPTRDRRAPRAVRLAEDRRR